MIRCCIEICASTERRLELGPIGFRGCIMMSKSFFAAGVLAICATFASASGADTASYGPELQGFSYPYPVAQFDFSSQRQTLHMAYMDVRPKIANGRTVALLHGKNFCAATWQGTINVLAAAGYRVIAPDQIGFCKSSKPERYQYSFQQLARNTHALLASLGVKTAALIAHSTGGMIAVRYALMYPAET
jgi:pimeloyl-ACP methyl ester carboxylesterase